MDALENQIQKEEYLLPDDYIEEDEVVEADETDEVAEETPEATEVVEEVAPVETMDDLEIKFLHEVKKLKDLGKDEVKTLVQKGMNHDRLLEKLEATKVTEGKLGEFAEIASLFGYDLDTLRATLENQYFEFKADQDGVTPETIRREYNLNKREKTTQTKNENQKMWERFVDKYPSVDVNTIKPETFVMAEQGIDMALAYEMQLKNDQIASMTAKMAELEAKTKTINQNSAIKQKAVVKSTIANGTDDPDADDDFMQGFLGKY